MKTPEPPVPVGPAELRLDSAGPGRQRWYVGTLAGRRAFAKRLEVELRRDPAILEAHANSVSSRVLIRFIPDTPGLDIKELLTRSARRAAFNPAAGDTSAVPPGKAAKGSPAADSWLLPLLSRLGVRKGAPSQGSAAGQGPLSRILRLALPEPTKLVGAAGYSALSQGLNLLRGVSLVTIVNTARGDPPQFLRIFGRGRGRPSFLLLSFLSFAVVVADFLVGLKRRRTWHALGESTTLTLRKAMYSHVLEMDMAFFDTSSPAELIQLIDRDCERIGRFVAKAGDTVVEKGLVLLVALSTLFAASPTLVGLISMLVPLLILPGRLLSARIAAAHNRLADAEVGFDALLENTLSNVVNVKSFNAETMEGTRFLEQGAEFASASTEAYIASAQHARGVESILLAGWYTTASFAGHLTASGRIPQSTYSWLLFVIPRLLDAPADLEELTRLYDGAGRAARRLTAVLDVKPRIASGPVRLPAARVNGEIVFDRVTFGYREGHPVLKDVSFRVEAGQTVAIVGPTGSGKSTLLRLLMRFYDVDEGSIQLDGHDVRELQLADLRAAVGLVPQEAYVFEGTIRDNVRYGRPDASDADVRQALDAASALEFVDRLPDGLDTRAGDRGRRLSGGERQRIALARTLLRQTPILALDEATSQLDYETEAAVQQSLHRKIADARHSALVVAHRLATVRRADRILVLEGGRITEQGPHDDLVVAGGLYQILWELQVNASPTGRAPLELRIRQDD